MKRVSHLFCLITAAAWLTGCRTTPPPSVTSVPTVALATSRYTQVLNIDRPVVTSFGPGETIAISIQIPRGGGYGEREGILIVRNVANGRVIRREATTLKEEDYIAFKQESPGPGKYNVEFIADNGVLATTWFEVR